MTPAVRQVVLMGRRRTIRVAGTRGEVARSTVTSASGSVEYLNRLAHKLAFDCSDIAILVPGYFQNGAINALGNSWTASAGAETNSVGAAYTWGGAAAQVIASGSLLNQSDWLPASAFGLSKFARGSTIFTRLLSVVTSGQKHLRSTNAVAANGEGGYFCASGSSASVAATGALSTPGGGTTTSTLLAPLGLIGKRVGGGISIMLLGDSIPHGWNDGGSATPSSGDGSAAGGYAVRGAWDIGGGIPAAWTRMTYPGTKAQDWAGTLSALVPLWTFFDALHVHLGTNDGTASRTAAATLTDLLAIHQAAANGGVLRRSQGLIITRTTSTDSWATTANQTPIANFATGGSFRDALNTSIAAAVGGGAITDVFSLNPAYADAVALDKWAVTGAANADTSDGTHPSSAITAAGAALAATHFAGLGTYT